MHVPNAVLVVLSSIPSPMPLIYYWRGDNYRRDLDEGAAYHLNQKNPLLHEIDIGDSLWAFTRRIDGAYILAAELVVSSKTVNHEGYKYGRYRLRDEETNCTSFRISCIENLACLFSSYAIVSLSFHRFHFRISQTDTL